MVKKVMQPKEWTKLGRNPQLGLDYLHAHYIQHAYPRHSHEYYVFCLIEDNPFYIAAQSISHRRVA